MMTLANYGLKSSKYKDPVSAKSLNKSLQIRNRAESSLRHCLKTFHRVPKERRTDIIDLLEEYYSRVPLNVVVWNTNEVKQCVVESILAPDHEFIPYKARNAFQSIESMLINLEYLPWHKEFTRICTYSGGFRHTIANPLSGVEEVLRSAGFEQEAADHSMHLVIQPMRQAERSELLGRVMFDCMLAQVVISDIMNVFESCCKSSKKNPSQVAIDEINCYEWIEHYFQERSNHITDKACSNIQELLNNVTNHLNRQRTTSAKSNSRIARSTDELTSSKMAESSHSGKEPCDTQQRKPNADTFRLSDDLLKLPAYSQHEDGNIHNRRDTQCFSEPKFYGRSDNIKYEGKVSRDVSEPYQLNHVTSPLSRSKESLDNIDGGPNFSRREFLASNPRPGILRNDREPLVSKQEKRPPVHLTSEPQGRVLSQSNMNNRQSHASQVPSHPIDQYRQSSADEQNLFRNYPSSQQQLGASKSVTSRYDTDEDDYRYEYRDTDRPFNSRLYWSCRSCTFINHVSNETCEMCRNRKLL